MRECEDYFIIALDQGITSSHSIIFDHNANIVFSNSQKLRQFYPKPGWVEQNPTEIWASQYSTILSVIEHSSIKAKDIVSIDITNQRETSIVWDKRTGKPVYNAIVWQCHRTSDYIQILKKNTDLVSYIQKNTGFIIDSYYSAKKLKWILDNVDGVREQALLGNLFFGTVDTWLLWNLTSKVDGEGRELHITDYTNASRTMLFNIHKGEWDERLIQEFNIPKSMLPEVRSCSEIYGHTVINEQKIPISAMAGDQQASLFGQNCLEKGQVKNTYGTGCFLLMNTGEKVIESKNNLITTMACTINSKEKQYVLEGGVFIGGAVIQWLRDEMRIIREAKDSEYFASQVSNNGEVSFVPSFVGLGAPFWD